MDQSLLVLALAVWASLAFFAVGIPGRVPRLSFIPALAVLLCYFTWRVAFTIAPHSEDQNLVLAWVVIFLIAEVCSVADFLQYSMVKSLTAKRLPDLEKLRRPETSGTRDGQSVDLLIPTYNEPIEVLRKTLIRAKKIDHKTLTINLLDDASRSDVRAMCAELGVTYFCRDDNSGAKAGNMNNALPYLKGDFLAVLDADFLAFEHFVSAALPHFDDPRVGCVQFPQVFYNPDPSQLNSGLFSTLRDEQWLWFRSILPERDLLDLATSCGSCSLVRRAALDAIGGRFPEETITEDFDLSLRFLEHGFITRYVNETVAIGLSAFTTQDFFKQRHRWALGNLNAWKRAFLRAKRIRRRDLVLLFEWRLLSLPARVITFLGPVIVLLFDMWPLKVMSLTEYLMFTVPFMVLLGSYELGQSPRTLQGWFASQARTLGVALALGVQFLLAPFSKKSLGFSVTPKVAGQAGIDSFFLVIVAGAVLSALGLIAGINRYFYLDGSSQSMGVVLFWQAYNLLLVSVAVWIFRPVTAKRQSERFVPVDPFDVNLAKPEKNFETTAGVLDISEGGLRICAKEPLDGERYKVQLNDQWVDVDVIRKTRQRGDQWHVSLAYSDPTETMDEVVTLIYSREFHAEILPAA